MQPSFLVDDHRLVPTPTAASPWSDEMVGGRYVTGLVAWAVEQDLGSEEAFRVGRITVDMFRPVPMRPLRLTSRTDRDGRRLRMRTVSLWDDELEVSRASVLLLATSDHPGSAPWAPDDDGMPDPETLPSVASSPHRSWEFRAAAPLGRGRGRAWIRELAPLVASHEVTPLVRAMAASDFVNPLANSGEDGLEFINADVTVYLSRYPRGEWVGLDVIGHLGADGIGMASGWLCDLDGRFGQAVTTAVSDIRMRHRAGTRRARSG